MSTKGLGSPEVGQNYQRALELCRQLGERPERFAVLRGLWEFHELRGELKTALGLGEELFRLAEAANDPALRLVTHDVLGDTLYWCGDFTRALEHLEQGLALYQIDEHRSLAYQHAGYDPCVACYIFSGYVLWYLGYPDRAARRIEDGLVLARELSQTFSLSLAMQFATVVHHLRGGVAQAKVCAETNVGLSTEGANVFLLGCGMVEEGWVTVLEGRHDEGLARIVQGMDVGGARGSGAVLEFPHCWAALADAYRVASRIEDALHAVRDGLAQASETSARFNEAELHRLRGELLLLCSSPKPDEAERCFGRPSRLRRARERSRSNFGPRRASGVSSTSRASETMGDVCWRKRIRGSPRDSTQRT